MELLKMLREAKHPSQDCQCPPCTAQVWLKKTLFPSITLWLRSPESSLSEQLPCDREAEPAHAQPGLEREESKGGMRSWVALRRRWGCPGSPPSPIPPRPARSRRHEVAAAARVWQRCALSLPRARRCHLFCKGVLHLIFRPFCEKSVFQQRGEKLTFFTPSALSLSVHWEQNRVIF